jgi:hypothetical protein
MLANAIGAGASTLWPAREERRIHTQQQLLCHAPVCEATM